MKLQLPSGLAVTIDDPATDFPAAIEAAELREHQAREDAKLLRKIGKTAGGWPVSIEPAAEGGAK